MNSHHTMTINYDWYDEEGYIKYIEGCTVYDKSTFELIGEYGIPETETTLEIKGYTMNIPSQSHASFSTVILDKVHVAANQTLHFTNGDIHVSNPDLVLGSITCIGNDNVELENNNDGDNPFIVKFDKESIDPWKRYVTNINHYYTHAPQTYIQLDVEYTKAVFTITGDSFLFNVTFIGGTKEDYKNIVIKRMSDRMIGIQLIGNWIQIEKNKYQFNDRTVKIDLEDTTREVQVQVPVWAEIGNTIPNEYFYFHDNVIDTCTLKVTGDVILEWYELLRKVFYAFDNTKKLRLAGLEVRDGATLDVSFVDTTINGTVNIQGMLKAKTLKIE